MPLSRTMLSTALVTMALALAAAADAQGGRQERRPRRQAKGHHRLLITPRLERGVNRGLSWLAKHQDARGSWSEKIGFKLNTDYKVTKKHGGHVGVTSLALMSFLAGGHVPGRGKYGNVLKNGVDYVLSCVKENGFIQDNGTRMYSHAFASLFLAEIYGMTHRRDVREALQRATTVIVDSQNAEGGWRYQLFARESDMSITVCQAMALRAARNVGITVPVSTIRAAENYVTRSAIQPGSRMHGPMYNLYSNHMIRNEPGGFMYQLRRSSRATFPLTAAGVTTLYAAGNYDSRLIPPALEYLERVMREFNPMFGPGGEFDGHYFYYYGHYYAVQAFFVAGGPAWKKYFEAVRKQLLDNQLHTGAWSCRVGPGKAFGTAVATLILQIPYQYLPIFQR
ncbi:MAG: prenyltransferase/squalene oxidase repeat-containing protein [Planctomycetota bacterium]